MVKSHAKTKMCKLTFDHMRDSKWYDTRVIPIFHKRCDSLFNPHIFILTYLTTLLDDCILGIFHLSHSKGIWIPLHVQLTTFVLLLWGEVFLFFLLLCHIVSTLVYPASEKMNLNSNMMYESNLSKCNEAVSFT